MITSLAKKIRVFRLILLANLVLPLCSYAQEAPALIDGTGDTEPKLVLNVEPVDLPYMTYAIKTRDNNFIKSFANPSMSQSLALTTSYYNAAHFGLKKVFKADEKQSLLKAAAYYLTAGVADFYLSYLPLGDGWLHEEYHRSVMTRRKVNSYNGINSIPIGADAVSVSRVTDADLIRFKAEAPQDFVRMHVAGIEGEYLMMDQLQRSNFFNRQGLPHEMLYILTTLNTTGYVDFSSDPETVDVETNKMNAKEPDISSRDFTGFDFTGWVYDLFRPEEGYAARGVHPLGNGIDRYRKTTDLTGDELRYLKRQGNIQYLNFLSPMMIGFRSITIDKDRDIRGNFAVRNILTSFGNDISLNLFAQYDKYKAVAIIHRYRNYSSSFHALEMQLLDYPLRSGNMAVSPRFIIGAQPKDQQFKSSSSSFFGYAGARVNFLHRSKFSPYFDAELKTAGWLAGNEFLNRQWGVKGGMSFRFF